MLILTRRLNERIVVADGDIEIQVIEIKPGSVALGITAPDHISVDREEIYRRKKESTGESNHHVPSRRR